MDGAAVKPGPLSRAPPAALVAGLFWLALAAPVGAESAGDSPAPAEVTGPPVPAAGDEGAAQAQIVRCNEPGSDGTAFVDRMQQGVYRSVCVTARWFDGLFGTRRYDQDSDATFGRIGFYELWDDRDGFKSTLRMRVRAALPAMENRLRLFFGRVDEREVVEDLQPGQGGGLPSSFQRVEDEAWLLGLGYSKQGQFENGFDFGAGIRIRTPVDPYVKGSYRHNLLVSEASALRARQTLFWRDSRGWGETTEMDLDHLLTSRLLLRWANTATLAEDVRRLEWTSSLITFQSLGDRRAISYTTFVSGVINTDVPLRNYGVELRYRQRIFRKWLFLEGRTSLTWPRETLDEERKINPGVGVGIEMYFGPVPDTQLR